MGLSRNKVAVSEGAAGSPPFYGEQADFHGSVGRWVQRTYRVSVWNFCCSVFRDQGNGHWKEEEPRARKGKRGCSSAGRAPALQAGGHGFDSHHLHHFSRRATLWLSLKNDRDFRQSEPTPISQEIGMMCAIENCGEAETICAHLGSDSHHLHR